MPGKSLSDISTPSWIVSGLGAVLISLSLWILSDIKDEVKTAQDQRTTQRERLATNEANIVTIKQLVERQTELLSQYIDLNSRVRHIEQLKIPPDWVVDKLNDIHRRMDNLESTIRVPRYGREN